MIKQTYLYRCYDVKHTLLYVGISHSALERSRAHSHKDWFDQVNTITIERHRKREDAIIAEMAAIRCENPKFNIVHSPWQIPTIIPKQSNNPYPIENDIYPTKKLYAKLSIEKPSTKLAIVFKAQYNAKTASDLLSISTGQVVRLIKEGKFPNTTSLSNNTGKRYLISGWDIIDYIVGKEQK